MPSRRTERIAEAIREVVASAIHFEVNDPRIQGVTVLRAEVASDLRSATVYVSLLGNESQCEQAFQGLRSARGFLQSKVAARLQTRSTPILAFKIDEGVKKSIAMSRLIDEALASDRRPESTPDNDEADDDGLPDEEFIDPDDDTTPMA